MMSECEKIESRLNDFLDGTLNAAQAAEFNAHLDECAACRREYSALKTTRDLLQTASVPNGDAARERVLARFRHTVGAEIPRRVSVRYGRWLSAGAVTFAAASLLLVGVRPRPAKKNAPTIEVASTDTNALPSLKELAEMRSRHTAQSLAVMGSVAENAPNPAPNPATDANDAELETP